MAYSRAVMTWPVHDDGVIVGHHSLLTSNHDTTVNGPLLPS